VPLPFDRTGEEEQNMATKKLQKKQGKRRSTKKLTSKKMAAVQTLKADGSGGGNFA
jgi:hypothetical protein